jgi:hypothetical protein
VRTVDRSSTLLCETSKISFASSGLIGASPPLSLLPTAPDPCVLDLDTDCGGVKIGAKLSRSRPGNLIPLDFRLCKAGKKTPDIRDRNSNNLLPPSLVSRQNHHSWFLNSPKLVCAAKIITL